MVNIVVATITLLLSGYATAFTQSYCSSQNTGSGSPFFWTYQTNGKCTDHCAALGTYAFAVIQFTNCWCTNYIPATTTDISDCQVDCPGYPSEKCGDKDAGLYIYIEGNGQPSGTAGGGGSSKPSSTAVSSSPPVPSSTDSPSTSDVATPSPASPSQRPTSRGRPPITVTQTVVGDSPVITVTPSQPPTSSSSSATFSSAPDKPSSTLQTVATSSATAMSTSVQVITESGAVVTRTIIYQPTAVTSQPQASSSSSSNTGAIVGGVVGGIAAILAIVGGILFFLWRRRKQQRAEQDQQAGITRNVSTMSKAGLLGGRVATDPHHPPPIATSVSHAGSRHDNESISPGSQRRYSQPMMIDSRLNPETVLMYHPTFGNSSRDSLGSIDDSRDFGRQLNVRNPDPH